MIALQEYWHYLKHSGRRRDNEGPNIIQEESLEDSDLARNALSELCMIHYSDSIRYL